MARNRGVVFSVNSAFVIGVFLTIILCLPSVKKMISNEPMSVGMYILAIVFVCHYCVAANFKLGNGLFWVLFSIQFLLAIILNLQGLAGMILVLVYNFMNMLSLKWYNRKLLLVSTQTIQDHYHERVASKVSVFDFFQIPVLIALFYLAYILTDVVFDNKITSLPLFF